MRVSKSFRKLFAVYVSLVLCFQLVPTQAFEAFAIEDASNPASASLSDIEVVPEEDDVIDDSDSSDPPEVSLEQTNNAAPSDQGPGSSDDASNAAESTSDQERDVPTPRAHTVESDLAAGALREEDLTWVDMPQLTPFIAQSESALPSMNAPAANQSPVYPSELDGNKIENVGVHWITADAPGVADGDPLLLSLRPGDDTSQSMQFQVEFSLSGQYDYEPGSVELAIPAQIWHNRDGNLVGTMTLSAVEDPGHGANFAWRLVDGTYIITNTRTLGAASKAMFQFTIHDIVPHEVVGGNSDGVSETFGPPTDAIQPTVTVTTHVGNTIQLSTADKITARMDTQERISYSHKGSKLYVSSASVPASVLANLPDDSDPRDYVYVRWSSYVNHYGNQPFTLSFSDELPWDESIGDYEYHGIMLGGTEAGGSLVDGAHGSGTAYAIPEAYTGYHEYSVGSDHYLNVWSAYPKYVDDGTGKMVRQFPPSDLHSTEQPVYSFHNTANWELASTDDQAVTKGAPQATVTYAPTTFRKPTGHFVTWKYTEYKTYNDYDYGYALNRLLANKSVPMRFVVESTGYGMPWTYDASAADPTLGESDPNAYGKRSYTMVTSDDKTFFDNDLSAELTSKDFEIAAVRFEAPSMYSYEPNQIGTYVYRYSSTLQRPDIQLWIRTQDGADAAAAVGRLDTLSSPYNASTYVGTDASSAAATNAEEGYELYATVRWDDRGRGTVTLASGGRTSGDLNVALPKGVTDYRTVVTTKEAGIVYHTYPTITLKSTERTRGIAEELFAQTDNPATKFRNDNHMEFYEEDGTFIGRDLDNSLATLHGATLAVGSTKSATYSQTSDQDIANRSARIHYKATVTEQTNITNFGDYDEAVEESGWAETSCTWYDLLPPGMEPDTSTIKLREKDIVTNVRTIENYRGSGRTMLVVEAKLTPQPTLMKAGIKDEPLIAFDALYSFDSIKVYGREDIDNVIAFESGNNQTLGNLPGKQGETSPYGTNNQQTQGANKLSDTDKALMSDLDPNNSTARFLYAHVPITITVDDHAILGLKKYVKADWQRIWQDGLGGEDTSTAGDAHTTPVYVHEGDGYSYRVTATVSSGKGAKDIVFYDWLENYEPSQELNPKHQDDTTSKRWRGAFDYVDVSALKSMGVAPVIYYALEDDIDDGFAFDKSTHIPGTDAYEVKHSGAWLMPWELATGEKSYWIEASSYEGPKSKIKAVAVDCRKDQNGDDFQLPKYGVAYLQIHMRAPVGPEAHAQYNEDPDLALNPHNNGHAFNDNYLRCKSVGESGETSSTDQGIWNHYTKVGIVPHKVEFQKIWDDGNNRDGLRPAGGIRVQLLVRDADGGYRIAQRHGTDGSLENVTPITLTGTEEWRGSFTSIPYRDASGEVIDYVLWELPAGNDGSVAPAGNADLSRVLDGYLTAAIPMLGKQDAWMLINQHKPATVRVHGTKTWDDSDDAAGRRPERINLTLYANGTRKATQTVYPAADGSWTYDFGELYQYENGTPITYTVEEEYIAGYVSDATNNGVVETGKSDAALDIANTYIPYGDLVVSKEPVDATPAAEAKVFEFQLLLNEVVSDEGDAIETAADGTYLGEPVGSAFEYAVFDAGDPYDPEHPVSTGTVATGSSIKLRAGQYAVVYRIPSESYYRVAEQEIAGFTLGKSTGASGLVRASSPAAQTRTLDDAARATFTNVYEAQGAYQPLAFKTLSGRVVSRGQFRLQLSTDEAGKDIVRTASNELLGLVRFGQLHYTLDDLRGSDGVPQASKTFTYYVREVDQGKPGYTYDDDVVKLEVLVEDKDGTGTLTTTATYFDKDESTGTWVPRTETENLSAAFQNEYHATGKVELRAWKALRGRTLKADEFSFALYDVSEGVVQPRLIQEHVTNGADGAIAFAPVGYTEADAGKTYLYAAVEERGDDETVEYTTDTRYFEVRVRDNGDGTLSAASSPVETLRFAACEACEGHGEVSGAPCDACGVLGHVLREEFEAKPASTPVFTNTLNPGTLSLEKRATVEQTDLSQEFTFKVRLTTPRGVDLPEGFGSVSYAGAPHKVLFAYVNDQNEIVRTLDGATYVASQDVKDGERATSLDFAPANMPPDVSYATPSAWDWRVYEGGSVGQPYDFGSGVTEDLVLAQRVERKPSKPSEYTPPTVLEPLDPLPLERPEPPEPPESPDDTGWFHATAQQLRGEAYAMYDSEKETLIFFRAPEGTFTVVNGVSYNQSYTIDGTTYSGTVFGDIEDGGLPAWTDEDFGDKSHVEKVLIADNVAIRPVSTLSWFEGFERMSSCDLSRLDTSRVGSMNRMFHGCTALSAIDVSHFDTSNVIIMDRMFNYCSSLTTLDVSHFDTSNVENMQAMFNDCSSLTTLDVSRFDTSNVSNMNWMFFGCSSLTTLDVSHFDTSNVKDMHTMFYGCSSLTTLDVSHFDTSNIKDISNMFNGCSSLASLDVSHFDTSNVIIISGMFQGCSSLTTLDVSRFDTSNVKAMGGMFQDCSSLTTLDVSRFDTSNVKAMGGMFQDCSSLTTLDVSRFDTSDVYSMGYMFSGCSSLTTLDVSHFDTSKAEYMYGMFARCTSLASIDTSHFKNVEGCSMGFMFWNCPKIQELNLMGLNTAGSYVGYMFDGMSSLRRIIVGGGFRFRGNGSSYDPKLTRPPSANEYSWVREDGMQGPYVIDNDDPSNPAGLYAAYDSDPEGMAGTWVWYVPDTLYKVAYGPNGGGGAMADSAFFAGEDEALPVSGFYRHGYRQTGWTDGAGNEYALNSTIPAGTYSVGDDVTLSAVWEARPDKLDFSTGEATITLRAGEWITIENVPGGSSYQIYEQVPAGWTLVSQEGENGTIEPNEDATATFTNAYQPTRTSASIYATKTLDGQAADGYAFALYAEGDATPIQTKQSAGGYVSFDPITYNETDLGGSENKTFTYTIREVAGADATIDYDEHDEVVTVQLRKADDALAAEVSYDSDGPAFQNTTKPGSLVLTKKLATPSGSGDAPIGEFEFEVTLFNPGGASLDAVTISRGTFDALTGKARVKLSGGDNATLASIPAGTVYEVAELGVVGRSQEVLPLPANGWSQAGASNMVGTIVAGETSTATVTNAYAVAPGSIGLEAYKRLVGGVPAEGEFSFALYAAEVDQGGAWAPVGEPLQVKSNDVADTTPSYLELVSHGSHQEYEMVPNPRYNQSLVAFDRLGYDVPGTYRYIIREREGSDPAVSFDGRDVLVTVVVTDNGDGTLASSVSYEGGADGENLFSNSYKPGELRIAKVTEGATDAAERDFSVRVALADAAGDPVAGGYEYAVTGGGAPGETRTATFGADGAATISLRGGQTATFGALPHGTRYEVAETDLPEGWSLASSEGTSGTVAAGEASEATLTNAYAAEGSVTIRASKVLEGAALTRGAFSFELLDAGGRPVRSAKNGMAGEAEAGEPGDVAFAPLDFTHEDVGTHAYFIREVPGGAGGVTYDGTRFPVTVTVADEGGDGRLDVTATYGEPGSASATPPTFTNTYRAEGSVELRVAKRLEGRGWQRGDAFDFVLEGESGAELGRVTATDGEPVSIGKLEYSVDDLGSAEERTFVYRVREVAADLPGIAYDEEAYTIRVRVADKGDGTLQVTAAATNGSGAAVDASKPLEFVNTYAPQDARATIGGTKTHGRRIGEGQFAFELYEVGEDFSVEEGAKPIQTAHAAAGSTSGAYSFSLTYQKPGTHRYVVREALPEGTEGDQIDGVTYDMHEARVTVRVSDADEAGLRTGMLVAEVSSEGSLDFHNPYEAEPATATLRVRKSLEGRAWREGEAFQFALAAEDGAPLPAAGRRALEVSKARPAASFGQITYTLADLGGAEERTFHYTIAEEGAGTTKDGLTYAAPQRARVRVTDDGKGRLVAAEPEYSADGKTWKALAEGAEFKNVYADPPAGESVTPDTPTDAPPGTTPSTTTGTTTGTHAGGTATRTHLASTEDVSATWAPIAALCAVAALWAGLRRRRGC